MKANELTDFEKAIARELWPGIAVDDMTPEGCKLTRIKAERLLAICRQQIEEQTIEEQTKEAPILTMELADTIEKAVNDMLKDICGELPRPIIMTIAVIVLSSFTGMPVSLKAFDKEFKQ